MQDSDSCDISLSYILSGGFPKLWNNLPLCNIYITFYKVVLPPPPPPSPPQLCTYLISNYFSCNISNTRKRVSSNIQTLRSRLKKKKGAAEFFFKRLRGLSDETHFRVFDMASQMINNSWRNSRLKVGKILW